MSQQSTSLVPREGMMATVRNRRAVISRVKPAETPEGMLHMVDLEYSDFDGGKLEETLLWEREVSARLMEPAALPEVHSAAPMTSRDFDALVRASRWSALTPFLSANDAEETARLPVASPFHGAVQVEDYQLVPLLKALQMPRISLLLADDVGLGKTIEAGLILAELLLRRRIRRVLILTPAALRDQWSQEMQEKFSLPFDIVDRHETHQLRRQLGLDTNPWRTFPRIIASYHYLRQHDVLQEFLSAARQRNDVAHLPWDLLIVDEVHNLMPAPFGEDSQLAQMLRTLSPLFEHKLFLTATPHNGHTRSFSGLLELLDPVRFNRTAKFTKPENARIGEILVRRHKREINEIEIERGREPRFSSRKLRKINLDFSCEERALSDAFSEFRDALRVAVASSKDMGQRAGSFAAEVLNKRLLSSPRTFGDSWYRFLQGISDPEEARQAELFEARRASEEQLADDFEKQNRGRFASRTAGAWLKPLVPALRDQISKITSALEALGIRQQDDEIVGPESDARYDALVDLIDERLREGQNWKDDERLIVFTEYKTTLDDLRMRLSAHYGENVSKPERIRVLYGGGMDAAERDAVKKAFNDPDDSVRVLVATDAASEGLNLQATARLLLHYEVPWNPSRLEQRNGRLDRHGQARDVIVFHFASDDDADLKFLSRVVEKVDQIRDDLGSLGEVFDAAFQRRFGDLDDADSAADALDNTVEEERRHTAATESLVDEIRHDYEQERIDDLCRDIDLDHESLRSTLEVALGLEEGLPRLDGPDERGLYRFLPPPRNWRQIIDETLRLPMDGTTLAGSLPKLAFHSINCIEDRFGKPVFRPARDTVLLHLGHPIFRKALSVFARLKYPGTENGQSASRWIVRRGPVPAGADALILVTVEEIAVNSLREPFHHWVRTIRYPVHEEALGEALPYEPPRTDRIDSLVSEADIQRARELWQMIDYDMREILSDNAKRLERGVGSALQTGLGQAVSDAKASFANRIAEVREGMKKNTINQLEKEREALRKKRSGDQKYLFSEMQREIDQKIADLDEELRRREQHSEELLENLVREKERIVQHLLPRRFSLRGGGVHVFPLTIEIRFREESL